MGAKPAAITPDCGNAILNLSVGQKVTCWGHAALWLRSVQSTGPNGTNISATFHVKGGGIRTNVTVAMGKSGRAPEPLIFQGWKIHVAKISLSPAYVLARLRDE